MGTIDRLRADVRDVQGYLDAIDLHIHWLGGDMDTRQVEIPAVKAAQNTLKRIDEDLQRLER
ncbi:MAG: hypothetical protein U9R15_01420 [Chloroflexota bacterium]|nr:hypothetical protein [Chloroflexota bacterium]